MAKGVLSVGDEDGEFREDTVKSYRGTIWALLSVAAFIIIAAILLFGGFIGSVTNGDLKSPAEIEQKRQ